MPSKAIEAVAQAVRLLSMDAVQKANSGHPGLPLGCAEIGALLYGEILKHHPGDPNWIDRDRFVLSAGHGCMLLYSLLHLSGYEISMEDIQGFRQLGTKAPGHPEYGLTPGVETTTGPLGQGISNAVGLAIAERMLAARFNSPQRKIIDHFVYVLAGDGDMMEGVSSEACSLAGHLGLGKLIVFYDSNHITIEGSTQLAFTENVRQRFEAYGWQTLEGDAYDPAEIRRLVDEARKENAKPSLILMHTVIGKGAPTLAGTHKVHGAPLGEAEIKAAKKAMGVPEDAQFYVPEAARTYFAGRREQWAKAYREWQETFAAWSRENPEKRREWDAALGKADASSLPLPAFKIGDKLATRVASGQVLNAIAPALPGLVGGSGDLAPSNNTLMQGLGDFQAGSPAGRNLHFGVREHAMGAITNGIALHGLRPFCATFLVFSDYMRPSIRLAAIMGLPVIYVFTHDSIYVGEDGPTHQAVEHFAALRSIPNLVLLRPGDAQETAVAWQMAIERTEGPTALALSRQNLVVYAKHDPHWASSCRKGAYVVNEAKGNPRLILVASGSEVNVALDIKGKLGPAGEAVRVVSLISRELFLRCDPAWRDSVLPAGVRRVGLETGVSLGWGEVIGENGRAYCLDRFGLSGPAQKVADHLGLGAAELAQKIASLL